MSKMSNLHFEISENAANAFAHYVEHFEKPANPYTDSNIGADKLWEEEYTKHLKEYEDWCDEQADRQVVQVELEAEDDVHYWAADPADEEWIECHCSSCDPE